MVLQGGHRTARAGRVGAGRRQQVDNERMAGSWPYIYGAAPGCGAGACARVGARRLGPPAAMSSLPGRQMAPYPGCSGREGGTGDGGLHT